MANAVVAARAAHGPLPRREDDGEAVAPHVDGRTEPLVILEAGGQPLAVGGGVNAGSLGESPFVELGGQCRPIKRFDALHGGRFVGLSRRRRVLRPSCTFRRAAASLVSMSAPISR